MKTKPIYLLFCLLVVVGCLIPPLHAASAPVVSQVSFVQEVVINPGPRRVTVTYTLAQPDSLPCTVFLEADPDGSGAYLTLTAVSGAVGEGVTSSPGGLVKTAVWDVGASAGWAKVLYPSVRIRVTATTDSVPPPYGTAFVTVGDAGNEADTTSYGAVGYEFQIQKFEFTNGEYVEFLNAVGGSNPNGIYQASMGSDVRGGITQSGTSPNFTYAVKENMGDKPVNFVSWFEAARVANWLHNGRSTDPALLETGAYTLNNATTGVGFTKNAGATYWLPSEDEWYKAAYHQPAGLGGDGDHYWLYPTRSNTVPGNTIGASANHANFFTSVYSVTQSGSRVSNQNYLTAVGSYPGSASFYGTFDQGGNVFEWNDAVISGSFRGLRGGSWDDFEFYLRSSNRLIFDPDGEDFDLGFRVASP